MLPEAVGLACEHLDVQPPLPLEGAAAFVMVDCAAHTDPTDELARALSAHHGVLALGHKREQLYCIRDHITVAIGTKGVPLKMDVAVPLDRLQELVDRVRVVTDSVEGAQLVVFGHLAEGNLHVNVLHAGSEAGRITDTVLSTALELGGTISAEHGIGVAKTAWMERLKGGAAVAAMRAVKQALDPGCIMNPGVLLPE
jgi:FAD/FMN-containing dehydrogenase